MGENRRYTAEELRQTAGMDFYATKLGLDDRPDLTDEIRSMLRQAAETEEENAVLKANDQNAKGKIKNLVAIVNGLEAKLAETQRRWQCREAACKTCPSRVTKTDVTGRTEHVCDCTKPDDAQAKGSDLIERIKRRIEELGKCSAYEEKNGGTCPACRGEEVTLLNCLDESCPNGAIIAELRKLIGIDGCEPFVVFTPENHPDVAMVIRRNRVDDGQKYFAQEAKAGKVIGSDFGSCLTLDDVKFINDHSSYINLEQTGGSWKIRFLSYHSEYRAWNDELAHLVANELNEAIRIEKASGKQVLGEH